MKAFNLKMIMQNIIDMNSILRFLIEPGLHVLLVLQEAELSVYPIQAQSDHQIQIPTSPDQNLLLLLFCIKEKKGTHAKKKKLLLNSICWKKMDRLLILKDQPSHTLRKINKYEDYLVCPFRVARSSEPRRLGSQILICVIQ